MFRFTTAGESHGKGLITIIEGIPAGLFISEDYINTQLKRRQGGYGRGGRMQIEQDHAEIISGVRHGSTIGSPISMMIQNRDWKNWQEKMSVSPVSNHIEEVTNLRPGHADLPGCAKYNFQDIRPILERASARETAARVAAGAMARRFLEEFGIDIHSHVTSIGGIIVGTYDSIDWEVAEKSPLRCTDTEAEKEIMAAIDGAKEAGDSLGGTFEVIASGIPIGLGSHTQWDRKINARIAQAIMSIQAVKGVEIGAGFAVADLQGSQAHDEILPGLNRPTNWAGGIEGGMTNGQPIVIQAAVKPIATIPSALNSIDLKTGKQVKAHVERADVCVVPAAGVIAEAMLAIVLTEACLEKFGGDSMKETLRNFKGYQDQVDSLCGQ